jgi:prophage DNA circulation protein
VQKINTNRINRTILFQNGYGNMVDPKKYRQQLDEMGIDGMEIDISTIKGTKNILGRLNALEGVLKKIRHNIRMDIREVRKDYMGKMQACDSSSQEGYFRRKSSKDILKEKKALVKEREAKISAYKLVEDMVDNYLTQIADSRDYIKKNGKTEYKDLIDLLSE